MGKKCRKKRNLYFVVAFIKLELWVIRYVAWQLLVFGQRVERDFYEIYEKCVLWSGSSRYLLFCGGSCSTAKDGGSKLG
jgi:hypothetical protein